MARRLRRSARYFQITLSAALIVVSTGFDAQRAAAQTLTGRTAPVSPARQLLLPPPSPWLTNAPTPNLALPALSFSRSAPMFAAPSAPVLTQPGIAASTRRWDAAASVAETVAAVAPALAVLSEPSGAGSAASSAGRDMEDALTGARSVRAAGDIVAVAGVASAGPSVPSALIPTPSRSLHAASAPSPVTVAAPIAAQPADKSIDSAASYIFHRWALKAVAAMTGAVFTLPQTGAVLTAKIIASAADKHAVFSDYDDTLARYNEVLPRI